MTTSFKYDAALDAWYIEEDPQDGLDYILDWSTWLGADTIATATWTVPSGITKTDESKTATTTTIWLATPARGNNYTIKCKIVTAGGRTKNFSFIVKGVPH